MMHKKLIQLYLFGLTMLLLTESATAQDTLLTVSYKGKVDSIQSSILQQKRMIQVFIPASYKPGDTTKYDVLYVIDGGNWNISLVTQLQRFLQNEAHMPPTIIVSIMGIDRNIELTPTVLKTWNAPTGGAEKFMGYIKNELIPFINKNYPSNGDNAIWGHSLGGMFVTYFMLNEPNLFKSVIAADPSYWWDDNYVPKMATKKLAQLAQSPITFFITGRQGFNFHDMRIDTMELVLKKYAPVNLKWKLVTYQNETHSSLRLKSIYDGLSYTYEGYTSGIEFFPANGIVLKDKPYIIGYGDDTTRVHYTLDGSSPTETSPQVQRETTVTGAATITFKRLTNRERYDKSFTGHFTVEEFPAPISKPKKFLVGGLRYQYFEGEGDKRPDLKTARPLRTGIYTPDFKPDSLPRKSNHAFVLDGLLEIKDEGYYNFIARAGMGSKVWLNGKLIMQWKESDTRDIGSFLVPLSKGFYPIHVECFDKKGDFNWLFYYLKPGMSPAGDAMPVPAEIEYSNTSGR